MDNQIPSYHLQSSQSLARTQSFFLQVYGWMGWGLLTTGILAYFTANSEAMLELIFGNSMVFFALIGLDLLIVFGLNRSIATLSATAASTLFFIYSAINGLVLASVFLIYSHESIATVFLITAGTFGAMSAYGYFTKADLSKLGSLLIMALIGLILASIVNIFMQSTTIMWITTYAGVVIFVGLTAYDTQRLKAIAQEIEDQETLGKYAVLGALILYLDFINLFLKLLRILGRRR